MTAEEGSHMQVYRDLVSRIGQGDADAESALYVRFRERLLFFAKRKVYQTAGSVSVEMAEDVCQDAWIAVLDNLRKRKLKDPEKLSSYIYRIFSNKVVDAAAKLASDDSVSLSEERIANPVIAKEIEVSPEIKKSLRRTWAQLGIRDKRILYLRYVHLWSYPQVAAVLGVSEENCRKVLQRAKDRFRKRFKKSG